VKLTISHGDPDFMKKSFFYVAGADLPDDDYTTLVPQSKATNVNNHKTSKIPIIIENKENDSRIIQSKDKCTKCSHRFFCLSSI
jgi:hypothetical protein